MIVYSNKLCILLCALFVSGCETLNSVSQKLQIGMSKSSFCYETGLVSIDEDPCFGAELNPQRLSRMILTRTQLIRHIVKHNNKLAAIELSERLALLKADDISNSTSNLILKFTTQIFQFQMHNITNFSHLFVLDCKLRYSNFPQK